MAGWPLPRWEAALGRWIPSGGWQASESEHSKSHPPRLAGGKAAGPRQCDLGGHRILWTEAGVTEYLYRALRPRVRGLRLPGPVQHDQAQGPCPVQDTQAGLQERPGLCTGPPSPPASLRCHLWETPHGPTVAWAAPSQPSLVSFITRLTICHYYYFYI